MKRLTWKKHNGDWGLHGADLTALPPAVYAAVYKLMKLEDAMSEPASPLMFQCCDKACGMPNDRARPECEDCPIMMAVTNLQVTSAELAGTAYSYERALDECRMRGAEISRLKHELEAANGALCHEWIPVTEHLPEHDVIVLVVASGRPKGNVELVNAIELATFYSGGWILEAYPEWVDAEVTHWMPLPPSPKEG